MSCTSLSTCTDVNKENLYRSQNIEGRQTNYQNDQNKSRIAEVGVTLSTIETAYTLKYIGVTLYQRLAGYW